MGHHPQDRTGDEQGLSRPVADTIAAIATPPGRGGIGVVRLSGPRAFAIAADLAGPLPAPRRAVLRDFREADGTVIDSGLLLCFPAPRSFTGEDVVELQGHGGPVVMDMLLARCLALGARLARPGEFSERAFLNDRLDLAQAEAIADLIDAGSRQAARAAQRSLQGAFSQAVEGLVDALTELRVWVEAALDFPEEEIDFLADEGLAARLAGLRARLAEVQRRAREGSRLREGLQLVIAGRPNAGKSSLLNLLAGRDAAIVTHIPGTTRDLLREAIQLDGLPLHVVDTAGLREAGDPVEAEGIRRAWQELTRADLVLHVVDAAVGWQEEDAAIVARLPRDVPALRVYNKIDLTGEAPGGRDGAVYLSAQSGAGLEALHAAIKAAIDFHGAGEDVILARRRHLDALARAGQALARAEAQLREHQAGELLAEELRLAQEALGEITGRVSADELLGRIFSSFCIGK